MKKSIFRQAKTALLIFPSLFCCLTSEMGYAAQTPAPPKVEILSTSPRVVVYHNFLSDEECDHLIRQARPHLKRSTVIDNNSSGADVDERRTSYGMFFPYNLNDPVITSIEDRISSVTAIPKENGENIQVLQYAVGGEYRPHHDYFDPSTSGGKYHLIRGGQRRASFLMYLNTPEAGGETIFPSLNINVVPRKGDALLFYNCGPDGTVDPLTLHGGAPVVKGEKWLATKWLRMNRFE